MSNLLIGQPIGGTLLALVSVGHGANVLVVGRYGELHLERPAAEELLQIALSLDGPFGEMDRVISMVSDEQERRALAQSLGAIIGGVNDGFIRPIVRQYPDLDPER